MSGTNYRFTARITNRHTGASETVAGDASGGPGYTKRDVERQVESRLWNSELDVEVDVTERKTLTEELRERWGR